LTEFIVSRKDLILKALIEHIEISIFAIVVIIVIGVPLGIVITRYRKIAPTIMAITGFLYTIPVLAFFGIMIPYTGIGRTPTLIALILYGLLPLVRNTYVGIVEVDKGMLEAAKGMGSTNFQVLRYVELPMALPYIIAAIRTITVMTISIATIAAFIGGGGLGVLIFRGITTDNAKFTLVGSLMVALLAIFADGSLGWIEKKINRKFTGNKMIGK
jgi:osmoprotectant transport system permease protein